MTVDTNFERLSEKLKPEDPCLPPRPWESIPSESGPFSVYTPAIPLRTPLSDTPIVSESSLVRLAINALQGMESALVTIVELCTTFDSDPADRTFHRISSIWKRTSSTLALGNILKSIGRAGCVVFLLRKFVDYFANLQFDGRLSCNKLICVETQESQCGLEGKVAEHSPQSLVNQAFSVAVRKLLEGFIAALDTLYASIELRHSPEMVDMSSCPSFGLGCLMRSGHSEVTLLEVYLHSKELRSQIEVIGNICHVYDIAFCFPGLSFEDLMPRANSEFLNFPRGGDLLTYLYTHLRVADPVHSALLKFLFLRSCEPYCELIRSWIYTAQICDPYKEFMVEYTENLPSDSSGEDGSPYDIWLATVKERDGVAVPCFLKDMSSPIIRAGQQLQVIMKVLELCGHISTENCTYGDILPCWSDFLSDHYPDAFPFSFNGESIETMVLARSNYYTRMMAKMDIILKKLEPRLQQVVPHGNKPANKGNCGESQEFSVSLRKDDRHISTSTDTSDVELDVDGLDCEASGSKDDFSYVEHRFDSSDCSSLDSYEEQNESIQFIELPNSLGGNGPKYLSALDLLSSSSNDNSFEMTCESDLWNPGDGHSSKFYEIIDANDFSKHFCRVETNLSDNHQYPESGKPNWSSFSDLHRRYSLCGTGLLFSGLVKNPFPVDGRFGHDTIFYPSANGLKVSTRNTVVFKGDVPYLSNMLLDELSSTPSSNSFGLQIFNHKYHSNPFSVKPVLFNSDLVRKHEERFCADPINHSPFFDFSSVENPCKKLENSSAAGSRHSFGAVKSSIASAAIDTTKSHKDSSDGHEILIEKDESPRVDFSLSSENISKENGTLSNACGGSNWESMLSCLGSTTDDSTRVRRKSSAARFEIPLDFVIEKCLLQEILHQYCYVSKLTIKLLEGGFNLWKHLSALRRFHFMGLADWADLFIFSIWHRKWDAMEADRKVSEIQGSLVLSLQKSSCEIDDCKDHLFVYIKGNGNNFMPLPRMGVDSFNFLGLGYKVDWPVSIVLTPGALEIYAQIFSFLLRVKLAILSLTDIWCSMKDLLHSNIQSHYSKVCRPEVQGHQSERQQLNSLTTIRHQVNHFVTTLQQYVQSQLSHVSWCRFTDSLKNKVKDMMDLESLHMAYLIDSLHICFLSDQMKNVARIIENILQCALDLRYCLMEDDGVGELGGSFHGKPHRIDISQVLAVEKSFKENLRELHACYLKAPPHHEFGLARFWDFLDYNEYYSNLTNERNYYGLLV